MKKIIIVSDSTRIGGIQKSLTSFLNSIDYSKYQISLFLFNDENTELINNNVNIIKSNSTLRLIGSTADELKKRSYLKYLTRKMISILAMIFGSNFIFSILFKTISIKEEFDIAISYSNNLNSKSIYFGYNKFVIEKIKAKKKMSWIHVDYLHRNRDQIELKEFQKMDKIILVSNACKNNFEQLYPELREKTAVIYNIINKSEIKQLSEIDDIKMNENIFNIISIGRIENNKNFSMQARIANRIKKEGLSFNWYILGKGIDEEKLKNYIHELRIEDEFILLGEKENVYPYVKKSSLLVSTSLSESFGLTIAEALALDIPVLALEYPTLKEIVSEDAMCKNEDELFKKIQNMIKSKNYYDEFKKNIKYCITNEIIKKQMNSILEE